MTDRVWLRAFRPSNSHIAQKVAEYMRREFSWDVTYDSDYGCICEIHTNGGTWEADFDDIECWDNHELLNDLQCNTSLTANRVRKLDEKFNKKIESVGSFTKVPFPKEKKGGRDEHTVQSL